ncbi:type II toxin-antitoxin system PemI/MazE family antitoxin [Streptococcus oricebi]|uniref:AbrB family transcriptional regulator n=1 Tax=Streptococcus oricebi TaxID=1547447 RepID=A0ABS5B1E0_9STRE|nr:AbrB/MazE/SpoVT family DNA-binding domain-containing protein [Streptococcus oricebi]MBP2622634.1 AbrB family transcriptional regulator [Streptococcus oricebi]
MTTVKTRKVGNSVTVTLPKEFGIPIGQEFIIEKGRGDTLILAPKRKNPFDGITDLSMEDDFAEVRLLDSEF